MKGKRWTALLCALLILSAESAIIFFGAPTTLRVSVQGVIMALAVYYDVVKQKQKIRA